MSRDVLVGYRWTNSKEPFKNQGYYSLDLNLRFGRRSYTLFESLFELQKSQPIAIYWHNFEDLTSSVEDIVKKGLEAMFLKGLRLEIHAELMVMRPVVFSASWLWPKHMKRIIMSWHLDQGKVARTAHLALNCTLE